MKTTFGRTFSTDAVIVLLALVLIGTCFQSLLKNYLTDNEVGELQQTCAAVSELTAAYTLDSVTANRNYIVNLDVAAHVSGADIVVCDADGRVLICSDALSGCTHQGLRMGSDYLHKILENGGDVATGRISGLYDDVRHVVAAPVYDITSGSLIGIIIVTKSAAHTGALIGRITNLFAIVSLLVLLAAIIAMSIFARRHNAPLMQMVSAAYSFGHGDLNARVNLNGEHPDEVEELALAFNNMAQELQKSEYQRREFVANVSHELKTPMTTISGYVDGILDGTIPPEKHDYYLQIVSDETKRLSRLVRSMLDVSRLQDQKSIPENKKVHFDMEECARQVLLTFEQKINAKGLDVDVDMPPYPICTNACRDLVTQVIYNLIDNAVKFCPDGGTLGLKVREGGNKVYVSVSNDGETIPPEELPLVFDRFHKLDKSRTRNRDGWGLGLYIVKTIVCSHGENISVTSRDGKTEFTFTMPLVN